jgi:hypothetical protein
MNNLREGSKLPSLLTSFLAYQKTGNYRQKDQIEHDAEQVKLETPGIHRASNEISPPTYCPCRVHPDIINHCGLEKADVIES